MSSHVPTVEVVRIEFRSDAFDATGEPPEEAINGQYGRDLCEWLCGSLSDVDAHFDDLNLVTADPKLRLYDVPDRFSICHSSPSHLARHSSPGSQSIQGSSHSTTRPPSRRTERSSSGGQHQRPEELRA